MLRSYEAIYTHGQLHWLKDAPQESALRVIVTVIEEASAPNDRPRKRRRPPPEIAGMMRLVGDDTTLLEPAIPEQEWDALK
jgi:hypothetical protein